MSHLESITEESIEQKTQSPAERRFFLKSISFAIAQPPALKIIPDHLNIEQVEEEPERWDGLS